MAASSCEERSQTAAVEHRRRSRRHTPILKIWSFNRKILFPLPLFDINLSVSVPGGGRSGVHVEFSSLSFYFRSYGDLGDEELDRVCHFLHNRVQNQENTQLYQLTACFQAFKRYQDIREERSTPTCPHLPGCFIRCLCGLSLCVAALRSAACRPATTIWTTAAASG